MQFVLNGPRLGLASGLRPFFFFLISFVFSITLCQGAGGCKSLILSGSVFLNTLGAHRVGFDLILIFPLFLFIIAKSFLQNIQDHVHSCTDA